MASYHGTADYPDTLHGTLVFRMAIQMELRTAIAARDKRCCLQPYEVWSSGSGIRPMVSSRSFRFRSQGISSPGLLHWPPIRIATSPLLRPSHLIALS